MSRVFVIALMIFCHIVDDFRLQGILANMKQKKWWREQTNKPMYQYDWVMALMIHSMSWSFMILLPIAIYQNFNVGANYVIVFFINALIHGIVDHLKANRFKINLIEDQMAHFIQIAITAMIML